MKVLGHSIIGLLALCSFNSVADDQTWDTYVSERDRFYYLDFKEFSEFGCRVEVTVLRDTMRTIRAHFDGLSDYMSIQDSLDKFVVRYNRNTGLRIARPGINIQVSDDMPISDPSLINKATKHVKKAFNSQVDLAISQLEGVFDAMTYPLYESFEIDANISSEGHTNFNYNLDGYMVVESYRPNSVIFNKVRDDQSVSTLAHYYENNDGLLMMTNTAIRINSPASDVYMRLSIGYQSHENLDFPRVIKGGFRKTVGNEVQEGLIDIMLTSCYVR